MSNVTLLVLLKIIYKHSIDIISPLKNKLTNPFSKKKFVISLSELEKCKHAEFIINIFTNIHKLLQYENDFAQFNILEETVIPSEQR